MSKILIVSDIHFDSYPSRTPTKDYRLNQSYQVVENLLEVAKKEETEYVFILGDILEKQNRDSPIHSVVKECLEKLMTGFKKGYYILGNHDMNARTVSIESTENDKINSYIHLYCPESLIYADRQIIDIDGVTFAFRNYSSAAELDLDFIKTSVDVLCGHSSQSYTDDEPPYPVQKYDEDKIKLYSFFGHIHQSVWKDKKVSIGVPQRCKISDDTPKVVIFDTLTKSWKYVNADPKNKLMDIKETTTEELDYFDEDNNIYYIAKKKPSENKELLKSINETNYDKIFESEIKSRGLLECFRQIKDSTPSDALERMDLDFLVTGLRIENWRTIKSFNHEFNKGDQFLVSGHNGAGKSSLYSALAYGLSGKCSGVVKDNIRFGETEMQVEVDLDYKGSKYTLKRGNSLVELWKDGSKMELGNKTQTKERIIHELPFIEAMDLLYYNDQNQRILGNSSASDTVKLQILYKILGLNEIDSYNSTATEIHKKLTKDFTKRHELYLIQESALNEKRAYLNSLEMKYGDIEGFDVALKLSELRKTLEGYQKLYQEKQEYDRIASENQRVVSEIEATRVIISSLQEDLRGFGDITEVQNGLKTAEDEVTKQKTYLSSLLSQQSEFTRLSGTKEVVIKEGSWIKQELDKIEEEIKRPVICSVYGIQCSLVTEDMKRTRLSARKNELEQQRESKLKEYYEVEEKLKTIHSDPQEINKVSENISQLQGKVSSIMGRVREYERVQSQLTQKQSLLTELEKRGLGGLTKPIELPGDILTRISDLSTEISTLEGYKRLSEDFKKAKEEFTQSTIEYKDAEKTIEDYQNFINLTKPSGIIYTKIFEIIMSSFSDTKVRYEVNVTKRGENRYINILSYLKKKDGEVGYSNASRGEKCMMDIHFLSNLKVKFGLLILDEFLGNLDQDNHDDALMKMQSLQTNLLFVTSHKENLMPFPSRIEVSTVNGNESKYTFG